MRKFLKKATVVVAARIEDQKRRRRIKLLEKESKDIFQAAMNRVRCQKPNGGDLTREVVDEEICSV